MAVKGPRIFIGAQFAKDAGLYPKDGMAAMENVVAAKGGGQFGKRGGRN